MFGFGSSRKKKDYSRYKNPKSKKINNHPVDVASVIVGDLSSYEKLPKNVKDHKRESVVVLKGRDKSLGVVYIHGKESLDGKSRTKKKEAGLWEEIIKNGQEVYVDLDIKITDSNGNPIKQGIKFKNTGVILAPEEMKKVEDHIYGSKKKRSQKEIVKSNRNIKILKKSG